MSTKAERIALLEAEKAAEQAAAEAKQHLDDVTNDPASSDEDVEVAREQYREAVRQMMEANDARIQADLGPKVVDGGTF